MSESDNKEKPPFSEPLNDKSDQDNSKKLASIARCKFILVIIIALTSIAIIASAIFFLGQSVKTSSNSSKQKNKNESQKNSSVIKGTYSIIITATDYGCGVSKAIVALERSIDKVSKNDLIVEETKKVVDQTDSDFNEIEQAVNRTVIDAFLCDEKGNEVDDGKSKYFAIELNIDPNEGSPFTYNPKNYYNSWCENYHLIIKLSDTAKITSNSAIISEIDIDEKYTSRASPADSFKKYTKKYGDFTYNFASYEPEIQSQNLFVWLNGAGEGGSDELKEKTNVEVTLLANKVTALAGKKFQRKLGGCHVLVPQAPTYWADDRKGTVFKGDKESVYLESVVELIDDYIEKNNITKVFIGGCSNGGYMTMSIALKYGDKYQGYVPICGNVKNELVTDDDIEMLKNISMYFIYSKDDETVVPSENEEPFIERLIDAEAMDLHVSTSESVIDTSGKYKDQDGKPYKYLGHFSWIYFFNDETSCDECEISAFEWMANIVNDDK